jgi:two-component system LytT family response regulator
MIRVVVVDDEPLARSGVRVRLAAQADVELVGEYGDGPSALAGLLEDTPDLVFLDVQMPGQSGLEVLAGLPAERRPLAILLTAYDNFAVRAFELQALDYLLKPIDDDRFVEALDRARQALAQKRNLAGAAYRSRFAVRVGRRVAFVRVADVQWIEADGDYATLHTGSNTFLVRESLSRLSALLDPAHFLRVHRSAIVRLDCVSELQSLSNRDALLRLHDGTVLRASRTFIEPLHARLQGRA